MTAKNDITGDAIVNKPSSNQYRDGWDRIFGAKNKIREEAQKNHPENSQQNPSLHKDFKMSS
jgi:hypothetical protein